MCSKMYGLVDFGFSEILFAPFFHSTVRPQYCWLCVKVKWLFYALIACWRMCAMLAIGPFIGESSQQHSLDKNHYNGN